MISIDALVAEAKQLYEEKRYEEMISLLNDAIFEEGTHVRLHFYRGLAYSNLKEYGPAIDDLSIVLKLDPESSSAFMNRGIAYLATEKYEKAIADFRKSLELRPDYVRAYANLGDAYRQKKDYDLAVVHYDKAIGLQPDGAQRDLYIGRAQALQELKEFDRAIDDLSHAISMRPEDTVAMNYLGDAWRGKGEYEKAIAAHQRALKLNAGSRSAWFGLGQTYEAMGAHDLASMHYKRAYRWGYSNSRLLETFRDKYPAPYIVKSMVNAGIGSPKPEINFANIEWLLANCHAWDVLLDFLRHRSFDVTHPAGFYGLEAMVNFYLGNSVDAYRIYDTQFESDEHPWSLSLRDQYYLALSAADFCEPDDGLAYAVTQAQQLSSDDPEENYYAGWLLLMSGDEEGAYARFDPVHLPSALAKWAIRREDAPGTYDDGGIVGQSSLLQGISPFAVTAGMSFEEIADGIGARIHFYELEQEIGQARAALGITTPRSRLPFSDLVDVSGLSDTGAWSS